MDHLKSLKLNSPFGDEPALFNLQPNCRTVPDETNEIVQTIKYLSEDHSDLAIILDNYFSKENRFDNFYESMKNLCDEFNNWADKYRNENNTKNQTNNQKRASTHLARYIMHLIYNRAVLDPDKLNQYEPFSPQVYGETSFDLIDQMLKRIKLDENDIFIDLGSGVGNVVLQVAAVTKCKMCYGFEKADWPAYYANRMENEFKFWMNFFGKTYSNFKIYKGDFLSQEEFMSVKNDSDSSERRISMGDYVKEILDQANLVFVNNYAFGAAVDHQLKLRFLDMPEGSIIVSSKPFCPLNFRINDRNINDIGAILNVTKYEPLNGHVSWTDKPINYYFQKIDRTLLEKYYESKKNPSKNKDESHSHSNADSERSTRSKAMNSHNQNHSPRSTCSSGSSNSSSSSGSSSTSDSSSSPSSPASSGAISPNNLKSKTRTRSTSKENKKRKSTSISSEANSMLRSQVKKKPKLKDKKFRKRSKSLDKEEKKTLEKMHNQVSKLTRHEKTVSTDNGSLLMKSNNINFNQKSMTKLSTENLDNKSLKDSKISPKFTKSLQQSRSLSNQINSSIAAKINSTDISANDLDETTARRELGDDIINSIDNYFRKCRKQYIKYLLFMKSPEYKEKVNFQYQKEAHIKNELLIKKEALESQKTTLIKTNIGLLKKRAAELGIKDLKSPVQLIQYAKEILSEHKELEEKINNILQTVQLSSTNLVNRESSPSSSVSNTTTNITIPNNQTNNQSKSNLNDKQTNNEEEKQSSILNKLLHTIDPTANVSSTTTTNNSSNNTSTINNTTNNTINTESKKTLSSTEKQDDNLKDKNALLQINDLKSVGSNHSTEETLTATERGDEEDDDMNMNDDFNNNNNNGNPEPNNNNNNNNNNNSNNNNDSNENDSNSKSDNRSSNSKSNKNNTSNSNGSNSQTHSANANGTNKSLIDKLLLKDSTSESSLRNFKIPKQSKKDAQLQPDQTEKSISPSLYSSSSSSNSSSNRSPPISFETNGSRHDYKTNKNNRNLCESPGTNMNNNTNHNDYSSSSSNSPQLQQSISNNTDLGSSNNSLQNRSYSNYYHPKKNQFRQYMMENSSSSNNKNYHNNHHNNNYNNNNNNNNNNSNNNYQLYGSNSDGYFNTNSYRHHDEANSHEWSNSLSHNNHHSKSTFNFNRNSKNNNHHDFEMYRNNTNAIQTSSSSSSSGSSSSSSWPYSQNISNHSYHLNTQQFGNNQLLGPVGSNEATSYSFNSKK